MRSVKYSLALACLGGLAAFASCTLITDVDRSKIPNSDASTPAVGGEANGGGNSGGASSAGDSAVLGEAGNAGSTN